MSHSDMTMLFAGLHSDDPCADVGAWGAVLWILTANGALTA